MNQWPTLEPPHSSDRILIFGASGWLGKTLQSLLNTKTVCLTLASSQREHYRVFSKSEIVDFDPTIVVNLAAVTRGYGEPAKEVEIERMNKKILSDLVWAGSLPRVRSILTLSSGAAVVGELNPRMSQYQSHKLREEEIAVGLQTPTRNVVIARAWSLTGPFVGEPSTYAFSDFIRQAIDGHIRIRNGNPTFRSYTSARDFIYVAMRELFDGWSGTLDSGGVIVELGALAESIREVVNPGAKISRPRATACAESYVCDDLNWRRACRKFGYSPLELQEQIEEAVAFLRKA